MGGQARSECCEMLARQSQPTLEMEVLGKRSLNIKPKTGKIIPPSFYLKLDLLKTSVKPLKLPACKFMNLLIKLSDVAQGGQSERQRDGR